MRSTSNLPPLGAESVSEEDSHNYHKWSEPYPRRCYCSVVGYTDHGRFYANEMSDQHFKLMKGIFPWFENKFKQPYEKKMEDL
jgi:hypothetical protein